ncbi:uncharacterized protein LOC125217517 [Salvia hispanica]|uniref:uncharacterized protein LOC125217517 n=1 Tax=Salvia hispanica TaxID=49212 RepID=UPI0020091719|nr:uncharacterized protein LOC125217517 [Salvia hispanica]
MENSQPLHTESFSYSWLTHNTPPPNLTQIYDNDNDNDFCFDVPSSSAEFVNADEIFSEGQIVARSPGTEAASVPDKKCNQIVSKLRRLMLKKWLVFVSCWSGKSGKVDDLQRKVLESLEASPRRSSASCYDVDENSISEAISYCKRSIEK